MQTSRPSTPRRSQRAAATAASAVVGGQYAAFTDPGALEESVLGRDVLSVFALIVDQAGQVLSLIRGNHRYAIQEA